jgi:hypothetical protein
LRLTSPAVVAAERRADGFETLLAGHADRRAVLELEGFFRGQVLSRTTEVALQVVPDAVDIGPAPPDPPKANLAVRASDEIIRRFGKGTGSVAVVLDCSGSMRGPKWRDAKDAVQQVLKESVPRGTKLSLWTFSQLQPGIPANLALNGLPGLAPRQIQQMEEATAEPERTITCQREPAAWDPADADRVRALLDQLTPFYHTPLVEALWDAADRDLAKAKGLRNLLVLTDGADDRFLQSRTLDRNGKSTIPQFLAERFGGKGIRVTVVYFRAAVLNEEEKKKEEAEVREARANFEKPLQTLETPGQFIEARDVDQLSASLRAGLRQELVWQVLGPGNSPVGDPLDVTRPVGDLLRWGPGLGAGFYTVRVLADRPFDQKVNLLSGDRLIVELIDDREAGIGFRRALYGDEGRFLGAPQAGKDWRLTILGNQRTGDKTAGLNVMAAVESTRTTGSILEQPRPGWAEFRLSAPGLNDLASAVAPRWRERLTYPGPVWQLDATRWPTDPADPGRLARPILTAWWLGPGPLPCDAEFGLDPAGFPFDVPLPDGRSVRVEDFRLEDRHVEDRPGEPPHPHRCLVIRLEYPKDSPYFIDPGSFEAVSIAGHEHRTYGRARKYAGLFWDVNIEQFNILRKGKFRLVPLHRLREEAERRGQKVEIKLDRPQENVKLEEPPPAIPR